MIRRWAEIQRRYFDRHLPQYQDMYGVDTPFHQAMTRRMLDFASVRSGEPVLEIGCGLGRVTVALLRAGCQVTGLDISEPTLVSLQKRIRDLGLAANFRPICAAAENLDFRQEFRLVIGRGILHHLEQPTAVLARVGRALVAGGRVAFMDPNPLNPAWIPFVTFHPALSWSVERHLLRGTPWRSRGILESCGFESVKIEFAGLVPPPLWGRVGWAADLEDRLGSWRFLHRLAIYLMVAGRKPHGS